MSPRKKKKAPAAKPPRREAPREDDVAQVEAELEQSDPLEGADLVEGEADDELELEQGVCQFCHCTDEAGCPLGCAWVEGTEHTVCTACEDLALDLGYAALEALVEAEGPIRR